MRIIVTYTKALVKALLLVGFVLPSSGTADVPSEQRAEVTYLLDFIRSSPCVFIRNGRDYPGARAYRHVLRKYDYFRDEIDSTERFIELSASVSTTSGEPYWYRCEGGPRRMMRGVLLEALAAYRSDA